MLASLRVRDLATIADVTLELGPGLNVLTGETGAGKSMLVDALALLLGDRADRAVVRPGASRAVIEGVFDQVGTGVNARVEAAGLDVQDSLVIRREVSRAGPSRAWINGSPTTVGVLASIGESLCDLHGQHQTLQLLDGVTQRTLLDAHGNASADAAAVRSAWQEREHLRTEQATLRDRRDEATRRADWLRHVIEEVDAAAPGPDEEGELEQEATRLAHATTLAEHAHAIVDALDGDDASTRTALGRAERALNALERVDPAASEWRTLLDSAYAQLDELARLAADYARNLRDDPARLAQLEHRLDLLATLRRKHGDTLADVLATRENAAAELDLIDSSVLDLKVLDRRITSATHELDRLAALLGERRGGAASRLARAVTRHLPSLGLASGEFTVRLDPLDEPGPDGAESVVFEVRLNRGMEMRPLSRTASGGELSRLMLALKLVLARHDHVPTLVFDEVDQGIGGEVGMQVGVALAGVAAQHQVLVITHLPQIAARADRHLQIAKADRGGVATTDVAVLHGEDRVIELARMLGDADDAAARKLAGSLLAAR
ncbi:MAG: DNA repair protein RecN [Gemmatimonadales bacterium]|nr:DNA repair protein RecN [Gemmatimonadales bacterium]